MISAFVSTWKRPDALNRMLANIFPLTEIDQIIIATQDMEGSLDDATGQILDAYDATNCEVIVLYAEDVIAGQKLAINHFRNPLTLWIDDDVIVGRDYLDLLEHFDDPLVGAVSGTLFSPANAGYIDWSDERIQVNRMELVNAFGVSGSSIEWHNKYQVYLIADPAPMSAYLLIGGAMLIRSHYFEFADEFFGGFSSGVPNFPMHEFDLTMSIRRKGNRLIFDPSRIAYHLRYTERPFKIRDEMLVRNWNHILGKENRGEISKPPKTFNV